MSDKHQAAVAEPEVAEPEVAEPKRAAKADRKKKPNASRATT
jgi:hypothetical protein